jgi:hypothetical protein
LVKAFNPYFGFASAIRDAMMLILLMGWTFEVCLKNVSCDMIDAPFFMRFGTGVQAILNFGLSRLGSCNGYACMHKHLHLGREEGERYSLTSHWMSQDADSSLPKLYISHQSEWQKPSVAQRHNSRPLQTSHMGNHFSQ